MDKLNKLIAKAKEQGIEIEMLQELDENRLDCVWYGGDLARITKGKYRLTIGAYGDIRAFLNDDDVNGHQLVFVKDKGNNGRFYDEMFTYIETDEQLHKMLDSGQLELCDANWLEWRVYDTEKQEYIGPDCFDNIYDSNNILDCLEVDEINTILDYSIKYEED